MADEKNGGAVVTEEKPAEETTVKLGGKKKVEKTGDLILDTAHELESFTKTKALNEAVRLTGEIEVNYFRLGGVLNVINENSWYEGSETFDAFVHEKYGFQARKARYLISIYKNLVTKQIPWEKVAPLGWTKLTKLADIITLENVDAWVEKALKMTVLELEAVLKAKPEGEGETSVKTTDEVVKISFKLKPDQAEIVNQALAKGKGELHTEFDTVALENICAGYLGGTAEIHKAFDLDEVIKATGFQPLLQRISDLFPTWTIEAKEEGEDEKAAELEAEVVGAK